MALSNAPWTASGYGKQTRLFAGRVAALGHDVAISAFWGLRGARLNAGGLRVYPQGLDMHGNDVLELHAKDFFGHERGGLVLTLTDAWVMQPEVMKGLNAAAWVPVDHAPCQPPTVKALREGKVLPIAMARFGEQMLRDEGFDPVYVPHGVETDVFVPCDRTECRVALDMPKDAFIVGMVAANQGARKSFPQAIRAFARFRQTHPDAYLYLHTWLGDQHQGFDLHELIQQELPGKAAESVMVCDQYRYAMGLYNDEYLAQVYSSLDLVMNPASGEGFGVPIIEAQACGTPVAVSNFSAMPELCGAGYLIGGVEYYTAFRSWQLLPDIDELQAALETEYGRSAAERQASREQARAFALGYDADKIAEEYWRPALAEIEARIMKPRTAKKRRKRG